MKKEGLYEKLTSIINCYPKGYELNQYNYPSLRKVYSCLDPKITFLKKDDYIAIKYSCYFNNYYDFSGGKYLYFTIKVYNNNRIKHDVPKTYKTVPKNVISYIEDEIYNDALIYKEEKKRRELEELIKEINRDPHIDKYKDMAKEILFKLGSTYRTDSLLDENAPVTSACSYEGYGLKIVAYDLPGYVYVDMETGKLQEFIKEYIDNISIRYKDERVFNSNMGIYKKGIWEDIFKELYNKLDVLTAKKEQDYRIREHCSKLLEDVIVPLHYRGVGKVNDSLRVRYYSEESCRVNNCGSFETDYHYKVIKDGKEVFHAIETSWNKFSLYLYTPGSWEEELKNY